MVDSRAYLHAAVVTAPEELTVCGDEGGSDLIGDC